MEIKQYFNAYIAFIDILGFKKLIETSECSNIYNIFARKFRKPISGMYIGTESLIDMHTIEMRVMSDSICFFVRSETPNALVGLVKTCQHFQNELIKLNPPILTRGAIVQGDLFSEGDILFGPGLVNAYLMEENSAKYPRIILTKEVIDSALANTSNKARNIVALSTFQDFDAFYTVDYFELADGEDTDKERIPMLTKHVKHILDTTAESSVRDKYLYLMRNLERWHLHQNKAN